MFPVRQSQQWVSLCCMLIFIHNVHAKLYPRETTTPSPTITGECGLCVIEATGGVQLIYWAPDDAPSDITYNHNEPYTQVQNGFTL